MTLRFNKTAFLSIFILTTLISTAQKTVYLEANDAFNGEKLKVEWRAESQKTGRSYVIKTEDGIQYFEMNKEDEVQLKAILDFYYVQDQLVKEVDINDGAEFKYAMEKRPSAILKLMAQGIESKRNEPAAFELFLDGRMVGRGNTTLNSTIYNLILNQAGTYEIVIKAKGFAEDRQQIEVKIANPANVMEKIVFLEKPAKEIAINFTDEQTGEPVNCDVSISETSSGKVVFQQSSPKGLVLFTFKNGINYKIKATSFNYKDYEKSLDGAQREDLIARLHPYTFVVFEILDIITKKEVPVLISLTSPAGTTETFFYQSGDKVSPKEQGVYEIEINSEGYISNSGTMTVNSLQGGKMIQSFSLVEVDKQFYITVIDHYSKKLIDNIDFRVFGPGGQKLLSVERNDQGESFFITDPKKNYFIEVISTGYQDFTKSLSEDNKRFTVELYWAEDATHSFKMVEKLTHKAITNGDLKLLDVEGQEVFVYNTQKEGVFLANMVKKTSINYSVSAEGYKSDFTLKPLTANSQELELISENNGIYALNVYDFLTNEPLKPILKYYLNKNEIDVIIDSNTKQLSVYFGPNGNYNLVAKQEGYRPFDGQIKDDMVTGMTLELPMKRESYPVKFEIKNLSTAKELRELQFRVITDNRVSVPEVFMAVSNLYQADLDGEVNYTLEIIKDGYETYTENFYVKDLLESNLIKSIELIKKEPEAKLVVITETPKEEIKKEEPVISDKVERKPIAEAKEIEVPVLPETKLAMAEEFSKKSSVGKRYLLDEVYFDQGSSGIRDAEIAQLNELAKTIKENDRLIIEIVGYTDNVGDPRLNLGLSQFRAKAVSNYLFNKGADPNRIKSNGFGHEQAVAGNDTEEERTKNRRVEMVLIEN